MEGTQGCALWINQLLCGGCESPRAAASLYRPGAAPCSKSLDLPDMVSSSEHRTMIWALSVSRGCREPAGDEIPMHGITATEYPSHP